MCYLKIFRLYHAQFMNNKLYLLEIQVLSVTPENARARVRVCVYVYICVYIYIYIHTHTHIYMKTIL
jgi:hypothetical protein